MIFLSTLKVYGAVLYKAFPDDSSNLNRATKLSLNLIGLGALKALYFATLREKGEVHNYKFLG